jgi:hypothetical protein
MRNRPYAHLPADPNFRQLGKGSVAGDLHISANVNTDFGGSWIGLWTTPNPISTDGDEKGLFGEIVVTTHQYNAAEIYGGESKGKRLRL